MKIGLYVPSWPPGSSANGIVTYASQLVPALRRLGHEVFLLTAHYAKSDYDPYVTDLRNFLPKRSLWNRLTWRIAPETTLFNTSSLAISNAVSYLTAKQGLDVFEIDEAFGWSLPISRLRRLPILVRLHGPWFLNGRFGRYAKREAKNRRRAEREGEAIQNAQFVTASSEAVLTAVKEYYGLDLTASCVIHNPLETLAQTDTWSIETCDTNKLLFIGRFDNLKGGDLVLHAFADLAKANPQLSLTFVGPDVGVTTSDGKMQRFEHFVRTN